MLHSSYYSGMPAAKILGKALRFYGDKFSLLFFPFLIVSPIKSLLWRMALDLIPQFKVKPGFTEIFLVEFINYLTILIPILAVFSVISWLIDVFPSGLIVRYSSDIFEGRPSNLKVSFRAVASKALSLLSASFIAGLSVILGFILLIIPGIIMAVVFSLTMPAIIIEGLGGFEGLRRSRELASREWWRVFSVLAFTFLLTVTAAAVGDVMCSLLFVTERYSKLLIMSIIISITKPLQPVALTYLYYSLSASQKPPEIYKTFPQTIPLPPRMNRESQEATVFHPKFCYKCGQRLPLDAVYCPRCGIRVKTYPQE